MKRVLMALFAVMITAIMGDSLANLAHAAGMGQPADWQLNLQQAATPVAESIHWLHNFLLVIIVAIVIFVFILLAYVVVRFNEKANPTASKTTHNTTIEVVWTVVPILILIAIAIPSFRLVYFQREIPQPDMTVKVSGHQWYWSYEYPDHDGISFDANMLTDEEAAAKQLPRLLATDYEVVVPVGKIVRVVVTGADVIHSFTVPSFGIKIDAIPGRLNEDWFRVDHAGVYYGQCSELCGKDHAYMPIMVRAVPQDQFDAWVEKAKLAGVSEAKKVLASNAEPETLALAAPAEQIQQ
jgi:cytochrome c oxidase subunit II